MARKMSVSKSTPSVAEIKEWYAKNAEIAKTLRDVTKTATRSVQTINKEELKQYLQNIGSNEVRLRTVARYLYYRSNIFYRLVNFYADMWDLRCRKVVPPYDIAKKNGDKKKMLKSYNETLGALELMNLHGNMTEVLLNVYVQDVCYAFTYYDDTGMFFYILEPDECTIDSRYATGDFGFSVDMSKWRNARRQQIIEFLGSPLKEMYAEYERSGEKWVHCPDDYAACFKFRTDTWDMVVPPFVSLFIQFAGLEDLVDIQAEADALSIYKLIYLPMKVHSTSTDVDSFVISPDLSHKYFQKLTDEALPDGVAGAMVPGDELKVIDFAKTVDSDVNSVEQASNQILQTAGGGAVINANKITSSAAFKAWLKSETEFAMSTLLPQINGFTNRFLKYKLNNPSRVEHFEVSIYTKDDFAEQLLKSCQYSFANRLAYNTLLGFSEKDTLAMAFFENDVLGLPDIMRYPLQSSYTQGGNTEDGYTSETGQGAPKKDDDDLTESGDRMRNK